MNAHIQIGHILASLFIFYDMLVTGLEKIVLSLALTRGEFAYYEVLFVLYVLILIFGRSPIKRTRGETSIGLFVLYDLKQIF